MMLSKGSFLPSKTQVRSLRTVPKATVFSLFLAVCLAGISLALVGLTANSLDFWNGYYPQHGNGPVVLKFQNYSYPNSLYSGDINNATWRNTLAYKDPNVSMTDQYALLVAGTIGTLCAGSVLAMPFWLQEQQKITFALGRGAVVPHNIILTRRTLIMLIDALLTTFFLAIATLVWVRFARATYASLGLYDVPDIPLNYTIHDLAGPRTTFETWNCGIYWYMATDTEKPSYGDIGRQCYHALSSRQLIIALLSLALARLCVWPMSFVMRPILRPLREFREWRRHTHAMREGKTSEVHDLSDRRKRSRDEEEGDAKVGEGVDSVHEVEAEVRPQDSIAELPGCRMSRVEMDEDAARAEMPGATGGAEMDAGPAAAEKDAVVKS